MTGSAERRIIEIEAVRALKIRMAHGSSRGVRPGSVQKNVVSGPSSAYPSASMSSQRLSEKLISNPMRPRYGIEPGDNEGSNPVTYASCPQIISALVEFSPPRRSLMLKWNGERHRLLRRPFERMET